MLATEQRENEETSLEAKKHLLFVDDEPNFLNGIRRMLRSHRNAWHMEFVNSVDEALEKTDQIDFDAIVSDVNMPLKNGLDLLESLRDREHTCNIPIIILTGNAETDLKRRALDLGATDLLNKPVGQEDLVARLRSVLRLKGFQDELRNQNEVLEERVRERTADLERARRDIIWRLAKAGEYRDEETGDHVIRVACCSRTLAQALDLTADEVQSIFLTSPLHDLGKIGIPDRILLKDGPLDDTERAIMEHHCEIGASILLAQPKGMAAFIEGPAALVDDDKVYESDALREMAATIIMTHHEKWDGTGYPKGLQGDDIPLCGQVVAVADVYDALRSQRPYKSAFSVEKTMAIMREGRGSHFSPEVFDTFERVAKDFEEIRQRFAG